MKAAKLVSLALLMAVTFASVVGCQRHEGSAEHAGKEVDKAVDKAGQKIEQAGDRIQNATQGDKK